MSRRILVVDDDRQMVKTLCDILALHGFIPSGVHSGRDAVAAIEAADYPVALMDVRMPGIDGIAATRLIKSRRPDTRVLLMTAHTSSDVLGEASRAGAISVINKPVDVAGLLQLLT